ncbi:hypothetical protein [Kitasatospora cineracea]|uniref:hypothetical protein n=1 Tax=Kitasatospora cineracea TaxID=88074 RepID=UPI0037945C35
MTTLRSLPIIGIITKSRVGYTATEPISTQELAEVIRSKWCKGCRTSDAGTTGDGGTYTLLAEVDGDVLAVQGRFIGGR